MTRDHGAHIDLLDQVATTEEERRVVRRILGRANRIPRVTQRLRDDDPLCAARGVIWGVIAGLLMWFGIALLVSVLAQI